MLKAVFLSVLIVVAVCGPSHAELYRYTDEKGNIRITDDPSAVPGARQSRSEAAERYNQRPRAESAKTKTGGARQEPAAPVNAGKNPAPATEQGPPAASSAKKQAAIDAPTPNSGAPVHSSGPSKLPPEYAEQFKDVIDASSIPPEGGTASCAEFKEGLKKDMDKVMQTMRDLAKKKKEGTLGIGDTMKGIWTLKSVAWVTFRMITGPEQCVKEFEEENKEQHEADTKEIEAMTNDIKDK